MKIKTTIKNSNNHNLSSFSDPIPNANLTQHMPWNQLKKIIYYNLIKQKQS